MLLTRRVSLDMPIGDNLNTIAFDAYASRGTGGVIQAKCLGAKSGMLVLSNLQRVPRWGGHNRFSGALNSQQHGAGSGINIKNYGFDAR